MNAIPAQLWLFLVKNQIFTARSYTQCLPKIAQKVKDNCLIGAILLFPEGQHRTRGINIKSSFALKEKKAYQSH